MTLIPRAMAAAMMWTAVVLQPVSVMAQSPAAQGPAEVVTLIQEQNRKMSEELRRIQREIAALRADLDKPGLLEIFAGIGYILGLFGIAAYVAARRKG